MTEKKFFNLVELKFDFVLFLELGKSAIGDYQVEGQNLPQKVAQDLSQDNLYEIKKVSDEIVKNQDQRVHEIFCEVIQILTDRIGPEESLDSLSDLVITNYFYLIASSKEYEQFFSVFERNVPMDYESILYKAIELRDGETIVHLIHKKPELLNITLRTTFSKRSMREFLLRQGFGEEFNQCIQEFKVSTPQEPEVGVEDPCFEVLKSSVNETVNKKAA